MATILQIPDAISLLGNLKSFIVSNSSEIVFAIQKDGVDLLRETYYPDAADHIEIQVADVIRHCLSTEMPSTDVFVQSGAVGSFTAFVDNVQVAAFTVVNAGVRKLSVTPVQFLCNNWLTWQPQTKRTTWGAPEYLSYFFTEAASVKAKFYLKAGTIKTVTIGSYQAGQMYTFATGLSHMFNLSGEDTDDLYGLFDIWVETALGVQLSYVQRYIYDPTQGDEHYYMCVNSLGGIDSFIFRGACTFAPKIEHEIAENSQNKVNLSPDAERKWNQLTGYFELKTTKWLFELLASSKSWTLLNSAVESIVIDTTSIEMSDRDNLHSCSFSFCLAEEGRLLNELRVETELVTMEVPSPSGDIFFLRARLSDYPDAELEDTILFLVQSPYTENWSKASLGAIRAWLLNIIQNSALGSATHTHSNHEVLERLADSSGKLTYDGDALEKESTANSKFLRKDVADRAAGLITFDNGVEFGTFVSGVGGTGGSGGAIDSSGNAELQSLILREWLEVPELRYNRVSIEAGNKWTAPGGGLIEEVAIDYDTLGAPLSTGIITLHLEDGEIGTVAVDDICHGIFHDVVASGNNASVDADDSCGNFTFAGFCSCYFRVTEILDARNQRFRYALRGISASWPTAHHPCEAMTFVCYGNFSDTDRQKSRYSTRTYERFLTGVNTWEFSSSNIAAQFGDLSNLSVLGLTGMTGYSAYLNNIYMSGVIEQIEDMDLRMEIDTDGDNFLAWGETLHLTCRVWRGGFFEEVTDDIVSWSITRDSGDAVEDAAWALKQKVQNFDGEIDICFNTTENDLGTGSNIVSTLFTVTASLLGGESAQAEITI